MGRRNNKRDNGQEFSKTDERQQITDPRSTADVMLTKYRHKTTYTFRDIIIN